jgi:hypothetical protein
MKKILYILLLAVLICNSTPSLAQEPAPADTLITPTVITPVNQQEISSGLESLMRYQEERRAKEKKAAMIRIGIGVALLIVLVIGLSRRKKK